MHKERTMITIASFALVLLLANGQTVKERELLPEAACRLIASTVESAVLTDGSAFKVKRAVCIDTSQPV